MGEGDDVLPHKKLEHPKHVGQSEMEKILTKLSLKPQSGAKTSPSQEILAKLSEQQTILGKQKHFLVNTNAVPMGRAQVEAIGPSSTTLATGPLEGSASGETKSIEATEVLRLKQELLAANSKIALQEQELAQTRVMNHTLDQALGSPSEVEFNGREVSEQTISQLQNAFNASNGAFSHFQDTWNGQEDSRSDVSDAHSAGAYNKAHGFWAAPPQQQFGMSVNAPASDSRLGDSLSLNANSIGPEPSKFWAGSPTASGIPVSSSFPSQRVLAGPSSGTANFHGRFPDEHARYLQAPGPGPRRSMSQMNRGGSCFPPQSSPWGTFSPGIPTSPISRSPADRGCNTYQQVPMYQVPPYNPRPIGTPLSPTATEFTSANGNVMPWTTSLVGGGTSMPTHVPPLEPLNYRRLLDKNVSCDWKYIVDKIVCNNDQQASIFLQQKLKIGTTEQKYDMVEAIVNQAYPLMVNRFGNFLVQRCFEHGTPEQVVAIANTIKGNALSLSMDPFGCHVIQKAFDCVPEEHKAIMVHELLRRIPETVIHRYACHVWQKLFELRWSGEPPQIMAKVNEALRGMWHEVALGETGSLVVQNIFENCVEDEKRPAIEEVIAKIDVLAHGQFGNWCIQHICEHGAPHDRSRAIEHILLRSVDYSMDQFASKIVEKCLKIGGSEFLDRYLSRVCTGRTDRPRMPLIDIAGDQYGNYLVQWVLINAASHQRELVASHIRKHMVSLRGSKFGSRVAMLCCNPSHATRPGPGTGMQIGRFNNFGDDRFQMTGQTGGRFGRGSQWNSNYPPFR